MGELSTQVQASWLSTLYAAWRLDTDRPGAIAEAVGDRARAIGIKTAVDVANQAFDACGAVPSRESTRSSATSATRRSRR